jgi:murein DD-endopeptidase MepM/ murein hydrolase activator NlpD
MKQLTDLFEGNYKVTQKFGVNKSSYIKYGLQGHDGVDFGVPIGTKLFSPFDGIVISVKYDKTGYGTHVKIWDKKQWCYLSGHMSRINIKNWQFVKSGQQIGLSGNTGNSTGPHLHAGICETNLIGMRLNKNNGFAGWLDILNKKLFVWKLK